MSEILVSVALLLGTLLILVSAVGINRFPDVYNRMHASGVGTTTGLLAILTGGTIFFSVEFGLTLKLLLVIPFVFWTASAGAFMTARAAHRTGPNLAAGTLRDDLSARAGIMKPKH